MFDVLSALPSSPQCLWPSPNSSLLLGLCTHCQSTCLDPRWASPYSALHGACYLTASGLTKLPKPMVCDLLYPLDPFRSFSLIFEVKSGQNSMYQPFPHLTAMVSSVSTSFPLSLTKISLGVALFMLWIFSLGPFFSVCSMMLVKPFYSVMFL